MLTKQNNSILRMMESIHGIYKETDFPGEGQMGIEIVGHALMIINSPQTDMLFFQVGRGAGIIVVQHYQFEGDDEVYVESKQFDRSNILDMRDFMLSVFSK